MKTPTQAIEEGTEVAQPTRRSFLRGSGLAAGAAVVSDTSAARIELERLGLTDLEVEDRIAMATAGRILCST